MKKIMSAFFTTMILLTGYSQKETFDILTFLPPKDWKKEPNQGILSYSVQNTQTGEWCRISIAKSVPTKGNVSSDFENEWKELMAKAYNIAEAPQTSATQDITEGWKIIAGGTKCTINKGDAIAMLSTFSGNGVCVSMAALTNSKNYLQQYQDVLSSVELSVPGRLGNPSLPETNTGSGSAKSKFAFTATNWDDGWKSEEKENWVEVGKGNIRVLVHYPNKAADEYNSDLLAGGKTAWNILVAPRYSNARNMNFRPHSSWQSILFAEADMTDNATGKNVYVVFFKKYYSDGSGKHLECIAPDKNVFENEFGKYNGEESWDKVEKMAWYNRFAISPADLSGKWSSDFSGATQYVNASTGFDAGMSTHASSESFQFLPGSKYQWDLGVASGMVGNIKFQSAKAKGSFSLPSNWKVTFSDISGKPRTYDAYFSCIKGLRILWLDNKPFAKME